MTEPTDNELDALLAEHWPAFATSGSRPLQGMRAAMRAAIAKWGTPPAVAGEPVAYCQPDDGNAAEAFSWPGTERRPHHTIPLYATPQPTPQPTQAQAGAVPLTDEQIDAALDAWFAQGPGFAKERMRAAIEAAHGIGIKGGQHGAE